MGKPRDKLLNVHYFGYFSLINLIRINVLIGKSHNAHQYISIFNHSIIKNVILKDFSAASNFFYYSGFAMMMTGFYKESIKIIENLCLFMNKYKQYMSRTYKSNVVGRMADKSIQMLAVALLFYPMTIESSLTFAIEKRLGDKLVRLQKGNEQVVMECLRGTPKVIDPILNQEHYVNFEK